MAGRSSRLWFGNDESTRNPILARLIQAAYRIEDQFFRFRNKEIDESEVLWLVWKAVKISARYAAREGVNVRNDEGLVLHTYKQLVNRGLKRDKQLRRILEDYFGPQTEIDPYDFEFDILRRNELQVVLECMDPQTLWITRRLSTGAFTMTQIAAELNMPRNSLYSMYRRGLEKAAQCLAARVKKNKEISSGATHPARQA